VGWDEERAGVRGWSATTDPATCCTPWRTICGCSQTNGKLERFHAEVAGDLADFTPAQRSYGGRSRSTSEFYNHRRYHEGVGNIAPADVYYERQDWILKRREEQKRVTLEQQFRCNRSRSMTITMGDLNPEP